MHLKANIPYLNECNASMNSFKVALSMNERWQAPGFENIRIYDEDNENHFFKGIKLANLWLKMICESHRSKCIKVSIFNLTV